MEKTISKMSLCYYATVLRILWRSLRYLSSKYLPVQSGNRNTRRRCEICTKLTMKTSGRCQRRYSVVFSVNFEQML